jgi:hypothetical protein
MRRAALVAGFLVLGTLALGACSKGGLPPEQVQAWVGRSASDLVKTWGAPTREVDDAGQRVLIYEEMEKNATLNFDRTVTGRQVGGAQAAAEENAAALGPAYYARAYLFWVDAAGAIVRAQIRTP